jgi:hypothetical protein
MLKWSDHKLTVAIQTELQNSCSYYRACININVYNFCPYLILYKLISDYYLVVHKQFNMLITTDTPLSVKTFYEGCLESKVHTLVRFQVLTAASMRANKLPL